MSASTLRLARERDLERLVALFFALLEYHAESSPRLALRPGARAEEQRGGEDDQEDGGRHGSRLSQATNPATTVSTQTSSRTFRPASSRLSGM